MKSKSNRAFTLIEVLITVGILSSAVIFIFRSFLTALNSVKFSQNVTRACYLAEGKIWEMRQYYVGGSLPQPGSIDNFKWDYKISDTTEADLKELKLDVSWKENKREGGYSLQFVTYLNQ